MTKRPASPSESRTNPQIQQTGFTLIEVLVALLITAIGLLGLVGLQSVSLKLTSSSALRSIATQRAYEISDRIRANRTAYSEGYYDNIWGTPGTLPTPQNCHEYYPGAAATEPKKCNNIQMAQDDAYLWQKNNTLLLPNGFGVVCLDNTPNDGSPESPSCSNTGNRRIIKIWWNDSRAGGARTERFVTTFQP